MTPPLGRVLAGSVLAIVAAVMLWSGGRSTAQQVPAGRSVVVLASSADPLALMRQVRSRRLAELPGFRTSRSDDCAGLRPGLYVAAVTGGPEALSALRARAPDAYVRSCPLSPRSLSALGVSAIDRSFVGVMESPINWSGADAVAKIMSGLLVRPRFVAAANDPREGLRTSVETLPTGGGRGRVIKADCAYPELASSARYVAAACAVETVADAPIYATTVYDAKSLKPVRELRRCRKPTFTATGRLRCVQQAVGSSGNVKESVAEHALPISGV